MDLQDHALEQLMCPVCLESCQPPIVQCINGHNVCPNCRPRITLCPICKSKIANIRNLFAENLSERVLFPCKNSAEGCEGKVLRSAMDQHIRVCTFTARCQIKTQSKTNPEWFVPCSWYGTNVQLSEHVQRSHEELDFTVGAELTHTYVLRRKASAKLMSFNRRLFWSVLNYDFKERTMKGLVYCLAPKQVATHYEFDYSVTCHEEPNVSHGNVLSSIGLPMNLKDYAGLHGVVVCQGQQTLKKLILKGVFKCELTLSLKTSQPSCKLVKTL